MKISTQYPPNYKEIVAAFPVVERQRIAIFGYGDTLFNPFEITLSQDLIIHESEHARQQAHNATVAKLWWTRYISDSQFRLEQEIEAYGAQLEFLGKDANRANRKKYLRIVGDMLGGPVYGNMIKPKEARELLTLYLQNKKSGIINTLDGTDGKSPVSYAGESGSTPESGTGMRLA